MASLQNFYTSRDNNANADSYVGQLDRLWYNPTLNSIYVSDGSTPGGIPVGLATAANAIFTNITVNGSVLGDLEITGNISAAANNKIGGIFPGPGVTISGAGELTIDTSGLPLDIGNLLIANTTITALNTDDNINIVSNGTGEVNLVGNIHIHPTVGWPGNDMTPLFVVDDTGFVSIFANSVPANVSGALNIVGSSDRTYQPVTNSGGMLHITGNDNTPTRVTIDSYGANGIPTYIARRARGTPSSPATVQTGDVISRNSYAGWTGTLFGHTTGGPLPTSIDVVATEDFTGTTVGTEMRFYNAPTGTSTRQLSGTITSSGWVGNVTSITVTGTGSITSNSATAGIGYRTGAGGTVTQLTDKTTTVTLNTVAGEITTTNGIIAGGANVTFTLNNSAIANTDVMIINQTSAGNIGDYQFFPRCNSGSATITITNRSNQNRADAITLRFVVIKGATN